MRTRPLAVAALCAGLAGTAPSAGSQEIAEASAERPLSPRNASYEIEARLDTTSRLLTASEIITWRNITGHATSELQLHLYFNAWRNADSSYLRAARLSSRGPSLSRYGLNDWGYCRVDSVSLLAEAGLDTPTPVELATEFIQPDDGNEDDRTVLRVSLPRPVGPGESVRVRVQWQLKVPRAFARVGVEGDFFMLGQWFPKVGVLEDDGTWNCHQFIQTEFFADFGVYDVALTTPAGWVVGATGTLVSSTQNADGTRTHRYHAEDVHDFAWTTSPLFSVHTDRFESAGLPRVDLELLLLPDHSALKNRYLESAKAALEHFGTWFHPYAWDRLTIVDVPSGSNTDSMEYPMLFTGAARWLTPEVNKLTEATTLHEAAHMWWQGAVANNEFEDAWLDEAVATYSHKRVMDEIWPPSIYEKRYFHGFLPFAFNDVPRAQTTHGADSWDGFRSPLKLDSLATPSYRVDERIYYPLTYTKGALMLFTLERHLGWETWRQVLATFAERFWFRHPKPADFVAVAGEVSGQDLSWFFDQALADTVLFDYAVDRVSTFAPNRPRGYVGEGAKLSWQAGGDGADTTGPVESIVDVRRWGEGVFPVDVRVSFDDGSVAEERWDGRARWRRFRYSKPARVQKVEVDPDRVLMLDVNSSNNSWVRQSSAPRAAKKWTAKWMIWLQNVMEFAAFFS